MSKRILSALLAVLFLITGLPGTAWAVGEGNMEAGGGQTETVTGDSFWNGDWGIRFCVVDVASQTVVSATYDASNRNSGFEDYHHYGKTNKFDYRNGASLVIQKGLYSWNTPPVSIPTIVRTSGAPDIKAIKNYFTDETVIRWISDVTGMAYDTLINGDYKLFIEPILYFTFDGQKYAMTATEAALFDRNINGLLLRTLGNATHQQLPLALYLEKSDLGFTKWSGAKTGIQNDTNIINYLGMGIVSFIPEEDPEPGTGGNGDGPTVPISFRKTDPERFNAANYNTGLITFAPASSNSAAFDNISGAVIEISGDGTGAGTYELPCTVELGEGTFIMVLLEGYLFLHYLSWLGKTGEPPGIVAFMTSMGALFTFFPTVPLFSADTWRALGRMYLAGLPVMALILGFFLLSTKRLDPFRGVEYGSARWASGEERRAFSNPDHTIPVAEGLYVDPQNNDLKNLHELVVGDTGAGKSFRVVIPDMLQMTGSYVVADVKGTLYRQTRQVMEDNGYKVRVLNLKDLRYSNCFNPLEYLEREDEVMALVDTFVFNSRTDGTGQGDQFWEDSMAMLLTSVLTYLVQTEGEEKTFARALELIGGLIVVKGEIMSFSPYEIQMRILEATDPGNAAVTFYKQFKQAPAETLQSILISTTSRLRLWNISDVKVLTARDEMNIDSLVEEKTVLYLVLPPQNRTYRVISAMFLSTLFSYIQRKAERKGGGKLPVPLALLLDEFANLGKINDFSTTLTLVRSYGIRVVLIIQSVQQLEHNYDKDEDTIVSNCAIYNYLGTNSVKTREDLVRRLGKTTITEESSSRNTGGKQGGGSLSDRGVGRELLTIDELAVIDAENKNSIVLMGGHPFFCEKFQTQKHPLFSRIGNDIKGSPGYANNRSIEED